jgi:hypothetical protein
MPMRPDKLLSSQMKLSTNRHIPCVTVIATPRTRRCEALAASGKKEGTAPLLVPFDYRPTVSDGTGAVGWAAHRNAVTFISAAAFSVFVRVLCTVRRFGRAGCRLTRTACGSTCNRATRHGGQCGADCGQYPALPRAARRHHRATAAAQ